MAYAQRLSLRNGGKFKAATQARHDKAAGLFEWTDDEKEKIARDSLEIMSDRPGTGRVEAMQRAVKRLPPARRQPVADLLSHDWILPMWDRIAAEHDAAQAAGEAEPMPTPDEVAEVVGEPQTALALAFSAAKTPAPASEGQEQQVTAEKPADDIDQQRNRMATARAKAAEMRASGELVMIRWKTPERRAVAKAYARLESTMSAEALAKFGARTLLFRQAAAEALPADRQRKISNFTKERDWLDPLMPEVRAEVAAEAAEQARLDAEAAQAEAQALAEREAAVAQETAEAEARAAQQAEHERMQAEHEQQARARAHIETQLAEAREREAAQRAAVVDEFRENASLEDLLGMFARRFARAMFAPMVEEFKAALSAEMQGVAGNMASHIKSAAGNLTLVDKGAHSYTKGPAVPERVRLPKIFIYGIPDKSQSQIGPLEKEFAGRFELSFARADELSAASRKAAFADMCVICSDYVPHSGAGNVQASAKEWTKVPGGLTAIRRWLSMYDEGRVGPSSQTLN